MNGSALVHSVRCAVGWVPLGVAVLSLAACGGGGGGSSTGSSMGSPSSTYTVSGKMTGLNASGLVLQDNGADNYSASSGATTFTFSTPLASSASFQVTVLTQPTGETCTVSNGTGTITADVTSVTVACAVNTYTISGTISGLSNAGLKLLDYSGGETLPVAAGATHYQFTQPVPYGTDVQVTVAAQPSLQHCTAGASNFSGPIKSNVTTDTFSCTPLTATVSTFAGSLTPGNTDGTGTAALFNGPIGVAVDASGNVYVADSTNNEIREITPGGVVTTLAGSTTPGDANGQGTSASFDYPTGVAVDSSGAIYVADFYNNQIRKIVCTAGTCTVSTLAGSSSGAAGHSDGTGSAASFNNPSSVAVDSAGNLFVADSGNNEIREVTPAGVVTTVAGSITPGHSDGSGATASFNLPAGVAVDSSGNVYVADFNNNEIRKIDPSGVVSTLAGSTTPGDADGQGSSASFSGPNDVAVDSAGNVYVADSFNNEIRMVAPTGLVSTVAGSTTAGHQDGPANTATFNSPSGVAVSSAAGTSGDVFVGDLANNEIREITP